MDNKKRGCLYAIFIPICIIVFVFVIKILVNGGFAKFDIKIAEKNAIGYIEDKYGFTPEIKEVKTYENIPEHMKPPSSYEPKDSNHAVYIMSDGSRDFRVEVSGIKEDNTGTDNYQSEEILQALTDKINSAVPGGTLKSIYLDGVGLRECMFDKSGYYDGKDLTNVLNSKEIKIIMCYYDAEFTACDLFGELSNTKSDVFFVSFDSQEIMEECAQNGNYPGEENRSYHYEYDMKDIIFDAPYIKDMWCAGNQVNERRTFELHDEGDFLYYCPSLASGESLSVTETDAKKVYEAYKEYLDGLGEKHFTEDYKEPVFRIVTKGYELRTNKYTEKVYVYFRRDAVDAGENHQIRSVASGPVANSHYSSDHPVGDYQSAEFDLSGKEVQFCFIDTNRTTNG